MTGLYDSPVPRPPAVSEHANKTSHHQLWNEIKFTDRDSHWYEEVIHIRFHPGNISGDNGIEIPKAWIPTITKHNRGPLRQQTVEGTT